MSQSLSSVGIFKEPLYILFVDDEQGILEATCELIRELGHVCITATDGMNALKRLKENQFDLVITDIRMPCMDGFELMRRIRADYNNAIDTIATTGYCLEYKYTDIINAGASDFIKKPVSFDELEAKINRIARERSLLTELKRLSILDGLTGLYHRGYFEKNLRKEAARALRQSYNLYLFLIDVDNFKCFNDKYGHQQGDRLIRELAEVISGSIRKDVDSGYRYGGDEFAVVLPHVERNQALEVAERIRTTYNKRNLAYTSLSIGLAKLKGSSDSLEESIWMLLRKADMALYIAKEKGGDQVRDETYETCDDCRESSHILSFAGQSG
jgi:diguanylate cyclase (GGDEF)-like protein